jgi:hypothetical protein
MVDGARRGVPPTTLENLEGRRLDILGTWTRRFFVSLLALVLVAGLAGWLGVRSATASASQLGWSVQVTYASVARAGLDVPWRVTVRHAGGFGSTVTLALSADYLEIYETQGFHPTPSAEWRDGSTLYLQFDTPSSDSMVVSYDAYIQPSAQQGRAGTLAVLQGGHRVATCRFTTHLLP